MDGKRCAQGVMRMGSDAVNRCGWLTDAGGRSLLMAGSRFGTAVKLVRRKTESFDGREGSVLARALARRLGMGREV